MLISIEGNIGSGKSTFFNYIKKHLESPDIIFLGEPVEIWESIKDADGNLLEHFYNDPYKYSYCFQMTAYISRLVLLKNALKLLKPGGVIITERCVFSDFNVFAKMLFESGKINKIEYDCYKMWFDYFLEDIPRPVFIYLRASPNTCYNRVISRARESEIGISLDYLMECEQYHDNWLVPNGEPDDNWLMLKSNVTVLDGNKDIDHHSSYLNVIKKIIHNPQAKNLKRKITFLGSSIDNLNVN